MPRVISLTVTACVAALVAGYTASCIHVTPPPVIVERSLVAPRAPGIVVAETEGTSQRCGAGSMCSFECPEGSCDFVCEAGSTCSALCPAGSCTFTCEGGATCNFECPGGSCETACAGGSTCNVDCDGGSCSASCAPGATCAGQCAGGNCS